MISASPTIGMGVLPNPTTTACSPTPRTLRRLAAKRKIDEYQQQYANNQNITFLPATMRTFTRESSKTLGKVYNQPGGTFSSAHRATNPSKRHPQGPGTPNAEVPPRTPESFKTRWAAPPKGTPNVGVPARTPSKVCTASFCVSSFYRLTERPRSTSPLLECQCNNLATRFAIAAQHSTMA